VRIALQREGGFKELVTQGPREGSFPDCPVSRTLPCPVSRTVSGSPDNPEERGRDINELALARELLWQPRMKTTDNPHQILFNHVFGRPENPADLVRAVLPPEIVEQLDLTSASSELITADDKQGRAHPLILVYSVDFRDKLDVLHILIRLTE
jgi:hypothetical protein